MGARNNQTRVLRTLGQQLDKQSIDIFDLRAADAEYVLECADPNPPFTDLLHLQYSTVELEALDLAAAQSRNPGFTRVNFEGMAETLRAIGSYVERVNAKLLHVSATDAVLDANLFRIEYQTRDGRHHSEEFRTNELVDLQIRMYKQRARIQGDPRARNNRG